MIRTRLFLGLLAFAPLLLIRAGAMELPDRWVYLQTNLQVDKTPRRSRRSSGARRR